MWCFAVLFAFHGPNIYEFSRLWILEPRFSHLESLCKKSYIMILIPPLLLPLFNKLMPFQFPDYAQLGVFRDEGMTSGPALNVTACGHFEGSTLSVDVSVYNQVKTSVTQYVPVFRHSPFRICDSLSPSLPRVMCCSRIRRALLQTGWTWPSCCTSLFTTRMRSCTPRRRRRRFFTCHSLCIHLPLTMYSPVTHY